MYTARPRHAGKRSSSSSRGHAVRPCACTVRPLSPSTERGDHPGPVITALADLFVIALHTEVVEWVAILTGLAQNAPGRVQRRRRVVL